MYSTASYFCSLPAAKEARPGKGTSYIRATKAVLNLEFLLPSISVSFVSNSSSGNLHFLERGALLILQVLAMWGTWWIEGMWFADCRALPLGPAGEH